MRKVEISAILIYLFGIFYIADWILFLHYNNDLYDDFPTLKEKYVGRFPELVKPLIYLNPQPAAIIFTILFFICGYIFIRKSSIYFKILSVTSFFFGAWNLFSVM